MLAARAIEGRSPALHDSPDPGAARAVPALAIIDQEALGEIAELAVGTSIIAKRRSTGLDGFADHLPDGADQPIDARQRQSPARASRTDSGAVKRLADVDIAKAGNDPLVEEKRLDRSSPPTQSLAKPARLQIDRLRPKLGDRSPAPDIRSRHQVDRAEPPGVVQRQPAAIVCLEQQMVVRVDFAGIDSPLAGHPEVEDERVAAIGVDEPELASAPKPADRCACQPLAEVRRKSPAKVGPPQLHADDPPPEQHLLQSSDRCFDFGEFRHHRDMAKLPAAS